MRFVTMKFGGHFILIECYERITGGFLTHKTNVYIFVKHCFKDLGCTVPKIG